jgi:N utilization substance protein A
MVVSELRGEKIDIIPYNDEPARFVAKALSPARVREVLVDDDARQATVIVPDDQLSLAIGREGQNARLAARLTGWRIDIRSETDFAQNTEDPDFPEEQQDGRCAAVLTNGRRCPNASLPGSRFCGLATHQALARFGTTSVAVLTTVTEDEIAVLANPEAPEDQVREIVERAEAEAPAEPATEALAEDAVEAGEVAPEDVVSEQAASEEVPAGADDGLTPEADAGEPEALPADEPVAAADDASAGEPAS